jgi:hypothetical protein
MSIDNDFAACLHKLKANSEDLDKLLLKNQQQANRILSLESQIEVLEQELLERSRLVWDTN